MKRTTASSVSTTCNYIDFNYKDANLRIPESAVSPEMKATIGIAAGITFGLCCAAFVIDTYKDYKENTLKCQQVLQQQMFISQQQQLQYYNQLAQQQNEYMRQMQLQYQQPVYIQQQQQPNT